MTKYVFEIVVPFSSSSYEDDRDSNSTPRPHQRIEEVPSYQVQHSIFWLFHSYATRSIPSQNPLSLRPPPKITSFTPPSPTHNTRSRTMSLSAPQLFHTPHWHNPSIHTQSLHSYKDMKVEDSRSLERNTERPCY